MRRTFSFRSMTTFITTWTFLLLIISGAVLYVSPAGRISNWTNWQLMALTKAQWQGVHTLMAIVFLVSGLFHLLKFNWKVFMTYMRRSGETGWHHKTEFGISLLLVLLVLAGTIRQVPPFVTVTDAGETIKNSWSTPATEPPVPHTELLSIKQVAQNLNLPPETALAVLDREGIKVKTMDETLSASAKNTDRTPAQIYSVLKSSSPSSEPPPQDRLSQDHSQAGSGAGVGFKTLAQVAEEMQATPAEVLERLNKKQIKAEVTETMRTIALRNNMKPYELLELVRTTP